MSVEAQSTETVMANHSTSTIADGLRSFATLRSPGLQRSDNVPSVYNISGVQGPSALMREVKAMKAVSLNINIEEQSQGITANSDSIQ